MRGRPEYELRSKEALERMRFNLSWSEPIAGDKEEAIAPMSAPCIRPFKRADKSERRMDKP